MNKIIQILLVLAIFTAFYLGYQTAPQPSPAPSIDSTSIIKKARQGYVQGTYQELRQKYGQTYTDTNWVTKDSIKYHIKDSTHLIKKDTTIKDTTHIYVRTYSAQQDTTITLRDNGNTCTFAHYNKGTFYSYPLYTMQLTNKYKNPSIDINTPPLYKRESTWIIATSALVIGVILGK